MDSKLNIKAKTGDIIYLTNESEAQTMEESPAYIYVIENIRASCRKIHEQRANRLYRQLGKREI